MKREPTCHYDAALGWLSPEHRSDCTAHDCAGCKPCGKSHCGMRERCPNHVEHGAGIFTCPGCIGKARKDLAAIVELYALAALDVEVRGLELGALLEEALSGIDSEAFNLIGPAAAPEQWSERRRRIAAQYERRGWCDWPRHEGTADDDPHHPYAVLGRWDMALREDYGPQTDLFVTVTSSADYLTMLLAGGFPHTQEFEDFAREIAACRAHLEQVTHDARVPEEGRQCPTCRIERGNGPRLRKRYAAHPKLTKGEQCDLDECRICVGTDDTWHCPDRPEHWWSERDYRDRVAVDYVQHADALTMSDLPDRTGIPAGTLRRWAGRTFVGTDAHGEAIYGPPRLRSRGRNADGRKVYRVEDVEALRVSLDIKTLDVSKSG